MTKQDIIDAIASGKIRVGDVVEAACSAQPARDHEIIELAMEHPKLREGELEVNDSNAIVSEGEDNGAYVSCWLWVSFAGTKHDKNGTHI